MVRDDHVVKPVFRKNGLYFFLWLDGQKSRVARLFCEGTVYKGFGLIHVIIHATAGRHSRHLLLFRLFSYHGFCRQHQTGHGGSVLEG